MKCLVLVAALIASVACSVPNGYHGRRNYGRAGYDQARYGDDGRVENYRGVQNRAHGHDRAGAQYAAAGKNFDQSAARTAGRQGAAASHYNDQGAGRSGSAYADGAHANEAGYNAANAAQFARKDEAAQADAHMDQANSHAHRDANVYDTKIGYGYDKKYHKHNNEDGDYEIYDHDAGHQLDEYRDHASGSRHADRASAGNRYSHDDAHANKASQYGDKAARSHRDHGRAGSHYDASAKAGGNKHASESHVDETAGKDQYYANAHDAFANQNGAYGSRSAAASKAGAANAAANALHRAGQGFGFHGHARGIGSGLAGYGVNYGKNYGYDSGPHGHGGAGYGHDGRGYYGKEASAAAAKFGNYGAGARDASRNGGRAFYNRKGYANAAANDYYRSAAAAGNTAAFHDQEDAAAARRDGYKVAHSDADATSAAKESAAAAANDAYRKDNFKRRYHDHGRKHHLVKKFRHHSDAGGADFERLSYNRRDFNDGFGQVANAANSNNDGSAQKFKQSHANAAANDAHRAYANNDRRNAGYSDAAHHSSGGAASRNVYHARDAAAAHGNNDARAGNRYYSKGREADAAAIGRQAYGDSFHNLRSGGRSAAADAANARNSAIHAGYNTGYANGAGYGRRYSQPYYNGYNRGYKGGYNNGGGYNNNGGHYHP